MSAVLTIDETQSPNRTIGRSGALCEAWTAHILKRAIADVASMSDADYRDFGLDKGEMLAALTRLRDEIKGRASRRSSNRCLLAIELAKR